MPSNQELNYFPFTSSLKMIPNTKQHAFWQNAQNSTTSHCGLNSIYQPLYSQSENSPNPCFVALITAAFHFLFAVLGVYQYVHLILYNSHGTHRINYSFGSSLSYQSIGLTQFVKLLAICIQVILLATLLGTNFTSIYDVKSFSLISIIFEIFFIIVPLHILEPTRSIVPQASLLLFWFVNIFSTLSWVLQDIFSPHKIYQPQGSIIPACLTSEIVLCINSIAILFLESNYYTPTKELIDYFELNEWDMSMSRNFFSEITLFWVQPTIRSIYEADEFDADKDNLPSLPIELKCESVQDDFEKYWNIETKKNGPSLLLAVFRANLVGFVSVYILSLSEIIVSYSQPYFLQKLLLFFSEKTALVKQSSPPLICGISIVVAMFMVAVARALLFNRRLFIVFKLIFSMQSSLSAKVYQKAMRLSPEERKLKTSGDIINHLSTDVATVEEIGDLLSEIINTPIRLLLCLYSLYRVIGNATWGGFIATVILVPLSGKVSSSIFSLYNEGLTYKDARMSLTSEIFNSIKSIKLYSWEKPMLERLHKIRNEKELKTNKSIGVFIAFSSFLSSCIPFCVSCVTFAGYAYFFEEPLTPDRIFPALTLFDMLGDPISMLPYLFSSLAGIRVSSKRLIDFFMMEELDNTTLERTYRALKPNEVSVDIRDASFVWSTKKTRTHSEADLALSSINFTARKSQLTCIVGKVGSGKSTLIKSILGEVPVAPGLKPTLKVNGTTAYCSQSPWILNGTVKENILFGHRYDKDFYEKTVKACELISDFKVLPDGDKTVVGEKGISLSGGQKARVSLARAVYSRSDIYLLDDVLSAVDAHVGKSIIRNVLGNEGILSSKTKILATNSVTVLTRANNIVLLKSGKITETGTYKDIIEKGDSDLADLIKEFGQNADDLPISAPSSELDLASKSASLCSNSEGEEVTAYQPENEGAEAPSRRGSIGTASLVPYLHDYELEEEVLELHDEVSQQVKSRKTGHTKEKSSKGKVKLSVYFDYLKACNYSYIFFYLLLSSLTYGSTIFGKYLLKNWSELNEITGRNAEPAKYLGLYAASGIIGGLLTFIAAFIVWTYCIIRGSTVFHDKMARQVLRSPMSFFETTPIGRVLNRFSEDIGIIDSQLPWTMIHLLNAILKCLSIFFVIVINLPPMAIVLVVLMLVYNQIRSFFIPASREIKRLKSSKSSPVFSHIQESVNGVETLLAYNHQERYIFKNRYNLDSRINADFVLASCNRWLSIRLQCISGVLLFTTGLFIVLTIGTSYEFSVGLVGFVLSYVLSITSAFNIITRMWADVETRSVAVERLIEYCNLPSEAPEIIETNRPKESWPVCGAINFNGYSTKYRENLDPVLRNINLNIKPSEKVGIVGRTGAGKSSLTLALFRIIEAIDGNIVIDGMDSSKVGLYDLRSKLSIIPQDAHTIEGSVRQNLDPFGNYTDEQLWKVLELAHLKKHVLSMKNSVSGTGNEKDAENVQTGLDAMVYEGGSNLSSGQKQLLCLARALLNPSKILILDEATAAVDVQTDKIIQDTIRKEFKDKTIITIAHRLETIMDSDRVVVLDNGEVKEFATVPELLENKEGIFRSLCEEGGVI